MNRLRLDAMADARRRAHHRSVTAPREARAKGDLNAGPGAPALSLAPDRGIAVDIRFSQPADPAASGCGPARGTAPVPPRTVARIAGNVRVATEVLRYAEVQAHHALAHLPGVQSIELLLGCSVAGETTCRLHVTFASTPAIVVGHSGPAVLHAIDTAVETTAHIVAGQTRNRP